MTRPGPWDGPWDKEFALRQVRRMAQLATYPKDEEYALAELVKAAMSAADTQEQLQTTIDKIMLTEWECPVPSRLRTMIECSAPSGEPKP
jgi:hypothetical protein